MLDFKFTQFALVPSQHHRQGLHKILMILKSLCYARHDVTLEKQTVVCQAVDLMYHSLNLLPGITNLASNIMYLLRDITGLFMDFSYLLPDFINLTIDFLIHIFAAYYPSFYGTDLLMNRPQAVTHF